jgi:extracellular factor (EF) 3-hydroxypalmitic acid methyl ester biosynthesis protein
MFKVRPEFKLVVADMQTFLLDFQRWVEQFALRNLCRLSEFERACIEREVVDQMQDSFLSFFGPMFVKFEEAAAQVDSEAAAFHTAYAQQHLHPLLLCSPFMRRTFEKPLGHAGDHEMVNMMMRDPIEGETTFAKCLNAFFLGTPPVVAHRNRVAYLKEVIEEETCRLLRQNRRIRIFNLGCGPAKEVQDFLCGTALSDRADFTLVDFSEAAINSTGETLNRIKAEHGRKGSIQMVQKSVAQLLKEGARRQPLLSHGQYDLVYCAGLFDYLPQPICARLVDIFYQAVAQDGSVLVTNVESSNPSRKWMEYAVDWHLIYRDRAGMLDLVPEGVSPDGVSVETELSGVNIFLKLRKFKNA